MSIPLTLRQELQQLARDRCECCLLPAVRADFPHEPDHIIAVQHRGTTAIGNLALACFPWNKQTKYR